MKYVLTLLFVVMATMPVLPQPTTPPLRTTVFISDLHIGVGHEPETSSKWDPYEDFRWKHELDLFLEEIGGYSGGNTDLILVGDTFELWQSVEQPPDCLAARSKDAGCTEDEALRRLQRVLRNHIGEMKAFRKFIDKGTNRLVIIPGNHDVALLFPRVAGAVRNAIGVKDESRLIISKTGDWISDDDEHRMYAEHGQQIGADVNSFKNWPHPFVDEGTPSKRYLQKTWGERFVQNHQVLRPI